nr:GspS/AspS pilotin family protein [Vibrio mexicanus]
MASLMRLFAIVLTLSSILVGCSSKSDEERQLELLAANRAGVLSAELPLEYGPLSILRANAKGSTIEIMMVYNDDARGAKPTNQVIQASVASYCGNPDVLRNLDMGLTYRIKMRNTRGQLMVDQFINKATCSDK